jgi:hypothetical protein
MGVDDQIFKLKERNNGEVLENFDLGQGTMKQKR